MNRTFTDDGRVIYKSDENHSQDNIKTNYKYYTGIVKDGVMNTEDYVTNDMSIKPGKQYWDGLTPDEKKDRVLIVYKTNDKDMVQDEYFTIHKVDNKGNPIQGIQFCIEDKKEKGECSEEVHPKIRNYWGEVSGVENKWITGEDGIVKIPVTKLPFFSSTLIEKGTPTKNGIALRKKEIKIYVDPGNRFLGEVKGNDFITYENLAEQITGGKIGYRELYDTYILKTGADTTMGGNWLKYYDASRNKIIYIAKKPILKRVRWEDLYRWGVVYNLDVIDYKTLKAKPEYKNRLNRIPESNYYQDTSEGYLPEYKATVIDGPNHRRYIVSLLKVTDIKTPEQYVYENTRDWYDDWENTIKNIQKSEWNRYIIPLTTGYRYNEHKEKSFKTLPSSFQHSLSQTTNNIKDYKVQLSNYNWYGDLTLGSSSMETEYIQENTIVKLNKVDDQGQQQWLQEKVKLYGGISADKRILMGNYTDFGAAYIETDIKNTFHSEVFGFRPVLEEIPQ